MRAFASFFDSRESRPIISRFSRPVSTSSTAANCPAVPMQRRTAIGSSTTSNPATRAFPPSGGINVERMRTRVVLPAPFGPSSASTLPSSTSRSIPHSALVSPKDARDAFDLNDSSHRSVLPDGYDSDSGSA